MLHLRRVRVFYEVVERGSFSAAVDALGFTQPSVSHHVGALERELGQRLINRGARPLSLTDAGELLYGLPENPTSPAISAHLRPNRSPTLPPTNSRLPNASAYAVTTHCRLWGEKCNARCADGSATVTIVASNTTINCATLNKARTAHRLGPALADPPSRPLRVAILGWYSQAAAYRAGPRPDLAGAGDRPRGRQRAPSGSSPLLRGVWVFPRGRAARGRLGVDVVVGAPVSSAFSVDRQDAVDVARRKSSPIRATERKDKKRVAQRFRSHENSALSHAPDKSPRSSALGGEAAVSPSAHSAARVLAPDKGSHADTLRAGYVCEHEGTCRPGRRQRRAFRQRCAPPGVDREAPCRVTSGALLSCERRISCLLDFG